MPRPAPPGARHIYNQYVVRVPADRRDPLRAHLTARRIGTEIYYPLGLHAQACFADLGYRPGDLPETEAAARETLALPVYPELSHEQQEHVVSSVVEFLRS
jgi:dTDP-4-amino-4,6-dideoxygalactose transaminase